jgi:hypothetical protein
MSGKLNTLEAKELRGIRKERFKRVANVVKGAAKGLVGGAVTGAVVGKIASGVSNSSPETKKQIRKISTATGAGLSTLGGGSYGSYKNPARTPEERKSERTRVKTLKPIVRAQRKAK